MVDSFIYLLSQPVLYDWCNKARGICGMVRISLLLIGKSSPCGGSGFLLSLSDGSFIILYWCVSQDLVLTCHYMVLNCIPGHYKVLTCISGRSTIIFYWCVSQDLVLTCHYMVLNCIPGPGIDLLLHCIKLYTTTPQGIDVYLRTFNYYILLMCVWGPGIDLLLHYVYIRKEGRKCFI